MSPCSTVSEAYAAHRVGERMRDGTIFAGISPDTGKAIYTTGSDAIHTHDWFEAKAYCEASEKSPDAVNSSGHKEWRVPTKGELNVLFQNRAAIGGFNESGSYPAGWYWSSSHYDDPYGNAWAQRFSDGLQLYNYDNGASYLRCVR
jgi:hypothetical protein